MLYANEPSIIIGKHQNAFAEINHRYVADNDIKVVRRLSGGGTVFHDSGNLNFCFIQTGQTGNLIDFKRFTQPIIEVLHKLGIPAERSGRNDLIIHDLKFSGNAEHVFKNRTLHHGTLLFSSRLGNLKDALMVNPDLYQDKAVKSVRSKVTNIDEHLPTKTSLEQFKALIVMHIRANSENVVPYEFSDHDKAKIQNLIEEKYSTWDWNYGYSPRFIFKNKGSINENLIEIELEVEKGFIKHADIKVNNRLMIDMLQSLQGLRYRKEEIAHKIPSMKDVDSSDILSLIF